MSTSTSKKLLTINNQQLTVNRGQAFLDILIATSIFLILSHAIFTILIAIYDVLIFSKNRLSSQYLASQKIEYLLNLPYDELGTTTGIPTGTVPEYEIIERNGQNYEVHTSIIYIDDPFDNIAPTDLLPTDYKQLRVSVNLANNSSSHQPVVLVTNVAPYGIETSIGGGTLSVLVIDALGQPVTQTQVHITNTTVIPNIDTTLQTNINGFVILPGAPPCSNCYHIQVSKPSYTSDRTYTTSEVANPNQRPITITQAALSETIFIIDRTSEIQIISFQNSPNFPRAPNSTFRLTGSKTIGTDADGDPLYKFDQLLTTNSNGEYLLTNVEWDNYLISIPDNSIDLVSINPSNPMVVYPNQTSQIQYAIDNNSQHSLLMIIKDSSGSAIASASGIISAPPNFTASASSGLIGQPNFGQIYFPNLINQTYNFIISHQDYATSSGSLLIDGDTLDTIILNKN